MGFKKQCKYIFVLIITFPFLFATCKKDNGECIRNSYSFKEKWIISPQRDSIAIGDTILFSSKISTHPFDYNTNAQIDFSNNALIGTSLSIRSIKGYNNVKDAVDSFSLFTVDGRFNYNMSLPGRILDIYWLAVNEFYEIKIGIIAKKKGDYSITLSDALGKLNNNNSCESGAGIILANNNNNNNAYLSHPYYGLPYVPGTDSTHIFCIRVK